MFKKHFILFIVSIISIAIVIYMYSQNYIQFEGGLHIVLPSKAPMTKSIEKFEPANIQPSNIDTNLSADVKPMMPSSFSTKIEEHRLFDDIIKAVQTFSPLVVPFITFFLYKKKKRIDKQFA